MMEYRWIKQLVDIKAREVNVNINAEKNIKVEH